MRKEIIGNATLYQGDCLEVMADIPDKGVDAVVTDPPYGIGFRYGFYKDTAGDGYQRLIGSLLGKPLALLQYPEQMMALICPVLGPPKEVMAWVYGSNLPRQLRLWGFWGDIDIDCSRSKQPARNPESRKVKNDYVAGYDWREFPQVKNVSPEKTEHPCQLPIKVGDWVIECLIADVVMDPFMGSGSIGESALRMGRKFIGIEIDPKYFDIACKRIEQAQRQGNLFTDK